jgi:hypothetical protein
MVKLLSYLRECIDLANGLAGNAGLTRKKANHVEQTMLIRCDKAAGKRIPGAAKRHRQIVLCCFVAVLSGLV